MEESLQLRIATKPIQDAASQFGTPFYLYDENALRSTAAEALSAPHAFTFSVRYAMKACPNAAVLRLFHSLGILIDASSGFEAERAMRAGIPPENIQITAQEIPDNIGLLVSEGVKFNACSLHQLNVYGSLFSGSTVSIRVNPGLGSGHTNRTNTGGPASSFGIWHEHLGEVDKLLAQHRLRLTALHSHIGAGIDIEVWTRCAELTLRVAERYPQVERVSLGGGYKIARVKSEQATDLHSALSSVKQKFEDFATQFGRKLHLEIEPGTFLVANAGYIVCRVTDVVDTGAGGYRFIKIDGGMTEILRPSLYGAQHSIWVIPKSGAKPSGETQEFVVVGHCCESGDILTPAKGDPEALSPRELPRPEIGDYLVIGGAGSYCAGMSAKNYNSFPEAPEVMLRSDGSLQLIRRRQTLAELTANEIALS